ncbi:MAG: hypothetical protein LAO31_18450 [Acidobacteriia bacterium]|nr:hypothetical protein [Terriglobia bacterium]
MKAAPGPEPPDFSLVLGGPLFQLYRRAHLSGGALELLLRRVLVITLFAWLPLLLLSVLDGHTLAGAVKISFLRDIEAHVRFLVALPALIIAELVVHRRISPLVRRFVERRIVVAEDFPAFDRAVNSAVRARNSVALELMLLVLVYTVGLWMWRSQIALGAATWYAKPEATHLHLTLAGYWYAFVSIPIFQFILLRWYMRLVLWFRFLWQVSRLNLRLTAAHPDRAGGIGFLGKSSYAFAPILFAQGALLAGLIANRVLYEGRALLAFKMEAAGLVGLFVLLILGPLVMFTPQLANAKRSGSAEYGLLANRYVFGFEEKWIRGGAQETSELLGTADIQSLADLANSYSVVSEMRFVPFGLEDILRLAAATAAPLLPLTLTIFSLEELLTRLVKILF